MFIGSSGVPSNPDLLSHPGGSRHKVETRDKIWRIISPTDIQSSPVFSTVWRLAAVWDETKVVVTCPGHVWALSSPDSILPCLELGENLVK